MKKADLKLVEKLIDSVSKNGNTTDTYTLKNGASFFVSSGVTRNSFRIHIVGEFDEIIDFSSREAFLKFLS